MSGYAVIDLETTGFNARGSDRIVELAVVHVDEFGRITGEWDTLVNPGRDLGPVHIHGIAAAEAMHAPRFAEVADELLRLLQGRSIVAHNAAFDVRFLESEFARSGYELPPLAEACLCTMLLARDLLPGSGRTLADCCAAFDIEIDGAHRALSDAHATARLLSGYLSLADDEFWWRALDRASALPWPRAIGAEQREWTPRGSFAAAPADFLSRISHRLPELSGPAEHQQYLALLDRALLDRYLSAHEADALIQLAEDFGLSRDTCADLHGRYFDALVNTAWADGILELDEIADLAAVAKILSIPADRVVAATQASSRSSLGEVVSPIVGSLSLQPGDNIVITGELSIPRADWHQRLELAGYLPKPAVTKKVKLVVAADPDSLSGKAAKARAYGIPIVGEAHLERLLAQ